MKDESIDNNGSPGNDVWKHDLYSDGPSKMNSSPESSIFIRNLPENMTYNFMRGLFKDDEDFISGIKVILL